MRIDVFADVVCPWCWIGEARLERALAERPEVEAEWHWRPFQLDPTLPPGGMPWDEFVRSKFGGPENAERMFAHVAAAGATDGLVFDFDRVARSPNTADAHRVIVFAAREGRQKEAAERLFRAHFAEGEDLNDAETLVRLGAEAGLDAGALRAWLGSGEGADEVAAGQRAAQRLGVTGVPFFVFDGRFAVSGAQPVEVFLQALDAAAGETEEARPAGPR